MHFLRPSPTQEYPESIPFGVSRDGKTVVGRRSNAAAGGEAFRWTADAGMAGLGFPAPAPERRTWAASSGFPLAFSSRRPT